MSEIPGERQRALNDVAVERERQALLKSFGRFAFTLDDSELEDSERLAALIEEVGGIGRNVLARKGLVRDGDVGDDDLRQELAQCAALAVAWMERLD